MKTISETSLDVIADIKDLVVSYKTPTGELRAVDNLNLRIYRGELLGIVGESGCGKTTFSMSLLNSIPKARITGSIKVDSIDVLSLKGEKLRHYKWEKTAMIFQSAMNALDPVRTIESQMVETIREHKQMNKGKARTWVADLLKLVEMDPWWANHTPINSAVVCDKGL